MIQRYRRIACRCLFLTLIFYVVQHATAAKANTFTVNSTADVVDAQPGDGKCETGRTITSGEAVFPECTLRAAVQEADTLAGKHEIILPGGTYLLNQPTSCTYHVKGDLNPQTVAFSALCLTGQVTINGAGADATIIDGGRLDRVALVSAEAVVQLRGVTVQNGYMRPPSFIGGGGAINNQGSLAVSESTFTGNAADGGGGGALYNTGTLTLSKSKILSNSAIPNLGEGGGLYNYDGEMFVGDSVVGQNGAGIQGGGLSIYHGTVTITGSTFSDNAATLSGGGIVNFYGTVTLTNSTISGNAARTGAGLNNAAQAKFNNVTITRNRSENLGGGIYNGGTVTLKNTLIAGNTDEYFDAGLRAPDCLSLSPAIFTSQGHNLVENINRCGITGDTATNITGQDAKLGQLVNNGGPAPTHALQANSPAIDAGDPASPGGGGNSCAATDQRGILRPIGGKCDIGAFEGGANLSVAGVTPNHGGNSASTITLVSGNNFQDGAAVKLRRAGEADISGTLVTVEAGGSALSASFELTGKALGAWDVVVTNPGGAETTLSGGFVIEGSGAPQLWSQIVGRSAIRAGLPARYLIVYGNKGNADALGVPLTITAPSTFQLNVYFSITPPPQQAGQVATNWEEVPVDVLPGQESGATNVLLFLPVVPAGSTGYLRLSLTLPPGAQHGDTLTFGAFLGEPFFNPTLRPDVLNNYIAGARGYAQKNLGTSIPDALVAELGQYATNQLQSVMASDRESLVTSFGSRPEVYSLAQLNIDLARFGAARAQQSGATSSTAAGVRKSTEAAPALIGSRHSSSPFRDKDRPARPKGPSPCAGRILGEGESCGDNPKPIPDPGPPPDPKKPGIPKGDCNQIPGHQLSSDGKFCVPSDKRGCPVIQNPFMTDPNCGIYPILDSVDPNDKAGPFGVGEKRYRQSSATPLPYTIFFENKPEATAPAQIVTITDQLDAAKLDLATFSLGPISFGKYTVTPPPGVREFTGALDLRPANDLFVKIDARLDESTGVVTWFFTSLDSATRQRTEDPLAGFLPPNKSAPEGEGSVSFFVNAKPDLPAGAELRNKSRIVFDVNAPIDTPEWLNTFDDAKPDSQIQALAGSQAYTSFDVNWAGSDANSGLRDYTIFVSENGAPPTVWLADTQTAAGRFFGRPGSTYSFYSVARDLAGNRQDAPAAAHATTQIAASAINVIFDPQFFVRQQYLDFLGREPDAPGQTFWTNEITVCGSDALCTDRKRVNTSGAYFLSTEFQSTGYFVYRLYKGALGRLPRYDEFMHDLTQMQNNIVVNNQLSDEAIENNKNAFAAAFLNRPDVGAIYGSLDGANFVDKLVQTRAIPLADAERESLINGLNAGAESRVSVLRKVLDGTTTTDNGRLQFTTAYGKAFYEQEYNPAFVLMQYFGYLRRDPDDAGYQFWLEKLNRIGNFIDAEMVRSFIVSEEYRRRFGAQ